MKEKEVRIYGKKQEPRRFSQIKQRERRKLMTDTKPESNNQKSSISFKDYLSLIKATVVSPFTTLKNEINKISDLLKAGVLALIIAGVATLLTLIKTMITVVRVKSLWTNETSWIWENLGNINYIKAIGLNFIIFLGIIGALAGIYYIASLIIKKESNFPKLLAVAVTTIIPMYICYTLISPILGMIWGHLGIFATILGVVYTLILTYELMNEELSLSGNVKFYLNFTCLGFITIVIFYVILYLLINSLATGLNGLLSL